MGGLKAHGEPGTCESVDIVVCLKMENSGLLWVDERCGHCLMSQGGERWTVVGGLKTHGEPGIDYV